MLNQLLREIHRFRKQIRDCQQEIEKMPKVLKAFQNKVAAAEKALGDAKEELKKHKAALHDLENRLKASTTLLAKHEKQLDSLGSPKEFEAKELEIKNTKAIMAQLEDEILQSMSDLDVKTAKIPQFEAAIVKAKNDLAIYGKESVERLARLKEEQTLSTKALGERETQIPAHDRTVYDRIIKAHGADALAALDGHSCTHCRMSATNQQIADINANVFTCCKHCGRLLYIA